MAKNIVLYLLDNGARKPLFSCDPDDASAPFLIGAAATDAVNGAKKSGLPVPALQAVLEERETDAGGVLLVKQQFTLLHPSTLSPIGEPTSDLSKVGEKRAAPAAKKARK